MERVGWRRNPAKPVWTVRDLEQSWCRSTKFLPAIHVVGKRKEVADIIKWDSIRSLREQGRVVTEDHNVFRAATDLIGDTDFVFFSVMKPISYEPGLVYNVYDLLKLKGVKTRVADIGPELYSATLDFAATWTPGPGYAFLYDIPLRVKRRLLPLLRKIEKDAELTKGQCRQLLQEAQREICNDKTRTAVFPFGLKDKPNFDQISELQIMIKKEVPVELAVAYLKPVIR